MALFLGLFTPNRLMEQTNSQILHPEHRSGTTANFQDIFFSLFIIPLSPGACLPEAPSAKAGRGLGEGEDEATS
jgi:hypothetical protein